MSRRGNRGGIAGRLGRGYRVNAQPQEEDSWDDDEEEEGPSSQEHTTDVDEDYPNGHDAEYESFAEFMDRRGYENPPVLGQLWQEDWESDIDDDVFSGDSAVDSDGSEESSATSASSELETDESEEDTEDDIQVLTPAQGPSNANPPSVRERNEEEDMDDEIQVIIPAPGPSNANPVHVGEGNENEPPDRHRPHSDGDSGDSDVELNVRRPKRRRQEIQSQDEESPPQSPTAPPAAAPPLDDDDDEDNCTICYEDFTTSGEHRLVSLKCGHFFGRNCIERWIRAEGRGAVCPTCKGRAALRDVRVHFSKNIKLADNSELVQLRVSNQDYRRRVDALEMDKAKLERELKQAKDQLQNGERTAMPRLPSVVRSGRMRLYPGPRGSLSLNPSIATYSRAFDFNGEYFAIGVHHPGTMFKPFAVRRAVFEGQNHQWKIQSTIPLHQNRCRVVAFSPFESSVILSAGEDRRAVVHNTQRNNTTQEWKMPGDKQVWSGCWISETMFAVGLQDGRVFEYDISLDSSEPVRDVTQGIGRLPIFSIVYDTESKMLLVTSFKSVVAFCGDRAFTLLSHDRDGFDKIQSFAWDPRSLSFAATFAPSTAENRPKTISHKLFRVDISENSEVSCTEVGVWITPHVKTTTMWNNCLFSLDDCVYFVAYCEDSKTIEAYDFSNKRPSVILSFSGNDNVTAMKALPSTKGQCRTIAILTEKNLSLVQFRLVDE